MAVVGVDTVTSISHRYVFPYVVDQVYLSNPVYFRLGQSNRIIVQGGYQIELPLLYVKASGQGWYSGLDAIDTTPDDTIKNGIWNWKQAAKAVTVDGLTLIKTDHPQAIANFIKLKFVEAQHWIEDFLGGGLFLIGNEGPKVLDGLQGAIDDGTTLGTYAGVNRTTDTWWKAQLDATTATMTLLALRSIVGKATAGSRHPTLIVSQQVNYDRYWNLVQAQQRFPVDPTGVDEQLAKAGFSNLVFDGIPWVVDSHVPDNKSVYFLNETYIQLIVASRTNGDRGFLLGDFQEPVNQDAMVAKILWAGNVVVQNCARQAKMTNLTG